MIKNILIVGGIGSLAFTLFVLLMSVTGIASEMRDKEGNFKKNLNSKALFGRITFVGFLLSLLYLGNFYFANSLSDNPTFFQFCLNSFGIFLTVHIFDLIILDYLIIVKWHPAFLKLPNTQYYKTITPHIRGFYKGIPIGIVASLVISLFSIITM